MLDRIRAFADELPARRAAHDANRRLDADVIAGLRAHGVLSCLLPEELGGAQLAPAAYVALLETLAAGDAATGWCAMTSSTSTVLAAYVPRDEAAALWAAAPFIAGVFAPGGKLDDGRLTGRWSYGSGSRHADVFVLGALAGRRHVVCFVRPEAVRIVDHWDTLGLAGTGSHDLVVEGAAPDHVTSVFDVTPWTTAPLYRMPVFGLLATGIAACALGIARSALAALRFDDKAPSAVLARYAALHAELAASRAYLAATCTAVHDAPAITPVERGELRLAASHVSARCADVVRGAFHLVGGAAIRAGHPVGAALRDIETLLTHKMVVDRVFPAAARAILGIGAPPPDL